MPILKNTDGLLYFMMNGRVRIVAPWKPLYFSGSKTTPNSSSGYSIFFFLFSYGTVQYVFVSPPESVSRIYTSSYCTVWAFYLPKWTSNCWRFNVVGTGRKGPIRRIRRIDEHGHVLRGTLFRRSPPSSYSSCYLHESLRDRPMTKKKVNKSTGRIRPKSCHSASAVFAGSSYTKWRKETGSDSSLGWLSISWYTSDFCSLFFFFFLFFLWLSPHPNLPRQITASHCWHVFFKQHFALISTTCSALSCPSTFSRVITSSTHARIYIEQNIRSGILQKRRSILSQFHLSLTASCSVSSDNSSSRFSYPEQGNL